MSAAARLLIVDDDDEVRELLAIRLKRAGYTVDVAADGRDALALVGRRRPDVIVTDMQMERLDGMSLFQAVRSEYGPIPVIILTAHGTIPEAVQATQRGVFAYLTKPFEAAELIESIERALALHAPNTADIDERDTAWRSHILTRSPVMEALLKDALAVAKSDVSVLILGESGTGKELLAQAIQKASLRCDQVFLSVNCTAIPESLFESEMFGHRKGSFTGADRDRTGLLETANGGTLFLDEIGDLPLNFQPKLLRAFESGEIRAIGCEQDVTIDVRLISATNADIEAAVERGDFREDLLYRLNVVVLELPNLARRREDIPLLAEHFLKRARKPKSGNAPVGERFSAEALELMIGAPWPGNIRQLLNVVEQCCVLSTTPLIPADLVRRALRAKNSELLTYSVAHDKFERRYLIDLLNITDGNVAQAARMADRSRSDFYKMLKRHEIDPATYRDGD